jgi:hypothetical protein
MTAVAADDNGKGSNILYSTLNEFAQGLMVRGLVVASATGATPGTAVEKAKNDFEKQAADMGADVVLGVSLQMSGSEFLWSATLIGTAHTWMDEDDE